MDVDSGNKTKLRTGFTTGSCATAASKACILAIQNQKIIENVDIILPKRSRLEIEIDSCEFTTNSAKCSVCLLYTSPSPRDAHESRMPSSA